MEISKVELLSVGIDVGSATSHLVFSNLVLVRDQLSPTLRFNIQERKIIYKGMIIPTPFLGDKTIDINALTEFFKSEYKRAGIDPDRIQTGAVIITGESAKKQNAAQIAEALSKEAGKFVASTAGPNFESLLAAMGSGATARSKDFGKTVLSCDIGGGTSNLAVSKNGQVLSTSCIAVGGRLLGLDSEIRIRQLADPALKVMRHIGLDYRLGDQIPKDDIGKIASKMAEVLIEVMMGPARSSLAKQLMVTGDLDFSVPIDEYMFSGGVAEIIYDQKGRYNDIGSILAKKIRFLIPQLKSPVVEPANKIRATVIGAGAYSLSVSGSSGFMDEKLILPLRNIPVLRVDVEHAKLSLEHVISKTRLAFQRHDLVEGQEIVALYFKDPVRINYPVLELFAKAVETALPNSIAKGMPIILIFEKDVACSVGNVIRRETALQTNLLSLDELSLNDGDWIDISEPLLHRQVFPVTVKSLVFPAN
ncbi:MAG: ethanolamine ammonia-lyase reactivating factor EutA [Deltaproteobacteria bacterium]|nr:ethanolamine ammonia-lyase reactivating factor EutA [Deltaproteobacteria bacterium]